MGFNWDKFKGKDVGSSNPPLEDGIYVLDIDRCVSVESRAKKDLFFAEVIVVESNNPKHPVGAKRSWCQNLNVDAAQASMTRFVCAAMGQDLKSEEGKALVEALKAEGETSLGAVLKEALDDPKDPACKNAFKGTRINCEVKTKEKTKSEGTFTNHYWSAYKKAA